MDERQTWTTPPQLGRRWGVKPEKVIGWIKRRELEACNLADRRDGRPRYRISPEAIDRFLQSRSVSPRQRQARRRQRADTFKVYV